MSEAELNERIAALEAEYAEYKAAAVKAYRFCGAHGICDLPKGQCYVCRMDKLEATNRRLRTLKIADVAKLEAELQQAKSSEEQHRQTCNRWADEVSKNALLQLELQQAKDRVMELAGALAETDSVLGACAKELDKVKEREARLREVWAQRPKLIMYSAWEQQMQDALNDPR